MRHNLYIVMTLDPISDYYASLVTPYQKLADKICDRYNKEHEEDDSYSWVENVPYFDDEGQANLYMFDEEAE